MKKFSKEKSVLIGISAATGENLQKLIYAIGKMVFNDEKSEKQEDKIQESHYKKDRKQKASSKKVKNKKKTPAKKRKKTK